MASGQGADKTATTKPGKGHFRSSSTDEGYGQIPNGVLESQLMRKALGDCTGLTVLDLGGSTGLHTHAAIRLGAISVDVIDRSTQMLKVAREQNIDIDRRVVRLFHADVSKPLSHLGLNPEGYDIVLANWIFSFADSFEALEGMFANIKAFLKKGGLFVGVRDADPYSPVLSTGKYGARCTHITKMAGGVKYHCVLDSDPPLEFDCSSFETIYSGSSEMYLKYGLTDIETINYEETRVVQRNREFWAEFLERPSLAMVKARRSGE